MQQETNLFKVKTKNFSILLITLIEHKVCLPNSFRRCVFFLKTGIMALRVSYRLLLKPKQWEARLGWHLLHECRVPWSLARRVVIFKGSTLTPSPQKRALSNSS